MGSRRPTPPGSPSTGRTRRRSPRGSTRSTKPSPRGGAGPPPAGRPATGETGGARAGGRAAPDEAWGGGRGAGGGGGGGPPPAGSAYLPRRYRLTQVAIMGSAPEAEPSPADLAAIVQTARRLRVTHVFFEPLVSPRLAQALAREIGAATLALDPIEGVSREQAAAGAAAGQVM